MSVTPKNNEKKFNENELLVTKTDLKGVITYANQVFIHLVGLTEEELIVPSYLIVSQLIL